MQGRKRGLQQLGEVFIGACGAACSQAHWHMGAQHCSPPLPASPLEVAGKGDTAISQGTVQLPGRLRAKEEREELGFSCFPPRLRRPQCRVALCIVHSSVAERRDGGRLCLMAVLLSIRTSNDDGSGLLRRRHDLWRVALARGRRRWRLPHLQRAGERSCRVQVALFELRALCLRQALAGSHRGRLLLQRSSHGQVCARLERHGRRY